ncbi:MAG: tRNA (adenosine(37)-N6)-threonylcarbamoyltransferase complex dimerization subunit type 1 TsaB [Clostridia bacterium]|nr:tRNA (adenosine(37)-N6)-threonylcarbamoyltransferase complex dimerization subunit type 1 TsaB [Clostridia bacterium]
MILKMTTLCIDTSSITCACAVIKNGEVLADILINNGLNHSKTLLPSIKQVLEESKLTASDIENISVTIGPGSFTGVKIAAATVKGFAFTGDTSCTAISTLEALAYNRESEGLVCAVMDARRGMLYNAIFKIENGNAQRITEDRQISCEELFNEICGKEIFITGDGTDLFKQFCNEREFYPQTAVDNYRFVRGMGIYKAAENCGFKETPHDKLVPEYLRLPQAERERLEKERGIKNEQ